VNPPGAPDGEDPLRLPLWMHQLFEYAVGLVLIFQSVHSSDAPQLAGAGAVVVLLAALTDAPCGAFRWIPPLLHRTLDVFVIAVLLLSPIVFGVTDPVAIVLCVGGAITLGWLHWHTRWIAPVRRSLRERLRGSSAAPTGPARSVGAPPAPSRAVPPTPTPTPTPTPGPSTADATARVLGAAVGKTTRAAPGVAGRAIGRARAAARRRKGPD
jgi:hypothetical protein